MVEPLRHRQTKGAANRHARPTATAPRPDSTQLSRSRRVSRTAGVGHEDPFTRPRLNARCRLCEPTFTGMGGKEEEPRLDIIAGWDALPPAIHRGPYRVILGKAGRLYQERYLGWLGSLSTAVLAAKLSEPILRATILRGRRIRTGSLRHW